MRTWLTSSIHFLIQMIFFHSTRFTAKFILKKYYLLITSHTHKLSSLANSAVFIEVIDTALENIQQLMSVKLLCIPCLMVAFDLLVEKKC